MKLGVIGSGAWGTALAITAGRAGSEVILWSRSKNIAEEISNKHLNTKYLGQIPIHQVITNTFDLSDMSVCDAILLVVPAQTLREICTKIKDKDINLDSIPLVVCAKGVEQGSLSLMDSLVNEYFPNNPVAILSGPNFADEVAKGLPACATIACRDKNTANRIIDMLGNKLFRLYYSDDVIGAQIGGSVKNVIAIACGIAVGKGLGENARAAIVTRGIAEMGRLCIKMGGKLETLLGLSGIGDITLTCSSDKSRNMSLGIEIGRGRHLTEILSNSKTVEGVATAKSVSLLAEKLGVDMPIVNAVKTILYDNASVEDGIKALLDRPFTVESN